LRKQRKIKAKNSGKDHSETRSRVIYYYYLKKDESRKSKRRQKQASYFEISRISTVLN